MEQNDDILIHYGMPRRSGRYPWGSGEDPYQHYPQRRTVRLAGGIVPLSVFH